MISQKLQSNLDLLKIPSVQNITIDHIFFGTAIKYHSISLYSLTLIIIFYNLHITISLRLE